MKVELNVQCIIFAIFQQNGFSCNSYTQSIGFRLILIFYQHIGYFVLVYSCEVKIGFSAVCFLFSTFLCDFCSFCGSPAKGKPIWEMQNCIATQQTLTQSREFLPPLTVSPNYSARKNLQSPFPFTSPSLPCFTFWWGDILFVFQENQFKSCQSICLLANR